MRVSVLAAGALSAALLALPAGAATNPKAKAESAPKQTTAQTRTTGWVAQCSSKARGATPDCAVTERIVLAQTGQMVAGITIRVPSDTRKPVLMLQAPLGLYLPPGMSLTIGKNKPVTVPLQTCDNNGCYAGQPVSDAVLKQFRSAESLSLKFQNVNRQDVTITVPLKGFSKAYDQVK